MYNKHIYDVFTAGRHVTGKVPIAANHAAIHSISKRVVGQASPYLGKLYTREAAQYLTIGV